MIKNWKKRQIDPTVDCVFKKLLGSKEHKVLTLDFINAMVGLAGTAKFSDLTIVDPHLHKRFQKGKRPIADLLVLVNTGAAAQVEIQNKIVFMFTKRCVYDWGMLLTSGLNEGEGYQSLRGAISIWILTENLFLSHVTEAPVLKFRVACPEEGVELEPDSYILVVQLKNWKSPGTLDSAAERWMLLFREGKNLDLSDPPKCLDDEVMRMALEVMRNFASDRNEFLRYSRELKHRRDNEWENESNQRTIQELRQAKEAALQLSAQDRAAKEAALQLSAQDRAAKEAALQLSAQDRAAREMAEARLQEMYEELTQLRALVASNR